MLRYVIATVPFEGHARLLLRAAASMSESVRNVEIHVVVVGWPNVQVSLSTQKLYYRFASVTTLKTKEELKTSDPMVFNLQRAEELAPALEAYMKTLPGPVDEIVYDFFALEAVVVARKLGIHASCSAAAYVGPKRTLFADRSTDIKQIEADKKSVETLIRIGAAKDSKECEALSDAVVVVYEGLQFWLYHPEKLLHGSVYQKWKNNSFEFVPEIKVETKSELVREASQPLGGSKNPLKEATQPLKEASQPLGGSNLEIVYISFGTVVTGSLWDANASVRHAVVALVRRVLATLKHSEYSFRTIIALPGGNMSAIKKLVENLDANENKSDNTKLVNNPYKRQPVEWYDNVDQEAVLKSGKVSLFITHAGCSSVRQAALAQVRMLMFPFFGDQHELAERAESLGWGIHIPMTGTESNVTNPMRTELCSWSHSDFYGALVKLGFIGRNTPLPGLHTSALDSNVHPSNFWPNFVRQHCSVKWTPGDLLYGTNGDRKLFGEAYPELKIQLFSNTPFSERKSPPMFIDEYHDALIGKTKESKSQPGSLTSMLRVYSDWLHLEPNTRMAPLGRLPTKEELAETKDGVTSPALQTLWQMCASGIEYFAGPNCGTIHFAIGPNFVAGRNRATTMELKAIRELCRLRKCANVRFYVASRETPSSTTIRWRRVEGDLDENFWFGLDKVSTPNIVPSVRAFVKLKRIVDSARDMRPFEFSGRIKGVESCFEKIVHRHLPVDDLVGFRITHLFTRGVIAIAAELQSQLPPNTRRLVTERGRVIYLVGIFDGVPFEIQLWPTALCTIFVHEHGPVYKAIKPLSAEAQERSNNVRKIEHELQDMIDERLSCVSDLLNVLCL